MGDTTSGAAVRRLSAKYISHRPKQYDVYSLRQSLFSCFLWNRWKMLRGGNALHFYVTFSEYVIYF